MDICLSAAPLPALSQYGSPYSGPINVNVLLCVLALPLKTHNAATQQQLTNPAERLCNMLSKPIYLPSTGCLATQRRWGDGLAGSLRERPRDPLPLSLSRVQHFDAFFWLNFLLIVFELIWFPLSSQGSKLCSGYRKETSKIICDLFNILQYIY